MILVSDSYSEFLESTCETIYNSKLKENKIYFEKPFIDYCDTNQNKDLVSSFSAKIKNFPYRFICLQDYKNFPIEYKITCVPKKLYDLLKTPPSEKMLRIIKNSTKSKDIREICQIIFCFLVDRLYKNMIFQNLKLEKFDFKEIVHKGRKFCQYGEIDAMQYFIRTIIWECIRKNMPKKIPLWNLQKNPIYLSQKESIAYNTRIIVVTMQDKRGIFTTHMPESFINRFFDLQKDKSTFIIHESKFTAQIQKSKTIKQMFDSTINRIRQLQNTNGAEKQKIDIKINSLKKFSSSLYSRTSYMLRLVEIYDEVWKEISGSKVLGDGKVINMKLLRRCLKRILFHLPFKVSKLSRTEMTKSTDYQLKKILDSLNFKF